MLILLDLVQAAVNIKETDLLDAADLGNRDFTHDMLAR